MAKPANKKDDGAKKKAERQSAQDALVSLAGVNILKSDDDQLRLFITILGKQAGLLDDKNKVKSIN